MPKPAQLPFEALEEAKSVSFREANRRWKIGYRTWFRLKHDVTFVPRRAGADPGAEEETVRRVEESVRKAPHLNTALRASTLGYRTERVQKILAERGLSNLRSRLMFAGFKVEPIRPLQLARFRRIVASYPGSLTHADYKTFGHLRRRHGEASIRVGGYVVIDSLTGFADLTLSATTGPGPAAQSLVRYAKKAPFAMRGLVLTDNGPTDFLTRDFQACVFNELGCLHRTTHFNHPWSNGKVEALNRTLKYQCFPTLCNLPLETLQELQPFVDRWMEYYNRQRAHTGHVNKGLPPLAWYELWKATPGDHLDKLVTMGVVTLDDEWTLRTMGSPGNGAVRPGEGPDPKTRGLVDPRVFAFVLEHTTIRHLTQTDFEPTKGGPEPARTPTDRHLALR